MKGLFAIFKMRLGLILNYRMAAIAGIGTQVFFGFVMVMIFQAFYQSTTGTNANSGGQLPMTLSQTVTYIWLGQGLLGLLPWNGDREIQGMIRNGDYAYELVRPMDMYAYWYYRILAQRIGGTLLRALPVFLVANFVMSDSLKMSGPVNFTGFFYFLAAMVLALFLGGAISNVITISVLFTIGDGIERLLPAIVTIFSGMVIPLAFFPDWAQPILKFLPFSGLVDTPYKFYLGIYGQNQFVSTCIAQGIWLVVLVLFGRFMLHKASKRLIVQGG